MNIDPLGAVSVTADVTVQGQSHETVLSQIVADELGLTPDDIEVVLELDTAKDQWSIPAGTYSSRLLRELRSRRRWQRCRCARSLKASAPGSSTCCR